jgi:hypothetical protein
MANIVDQEAVAIAPAGHVKVVSGSPVVVPEGLVEKEITSTAIVGETEGVADYEEAERLPESGIPVEFFARTRNGLDWLSWIGIEFGVRDSEFCGWESEASGKQADLDEWGAKIGWKECVLGRSGERGCGGRVSR